jgi:hypothetical protein
MHLTQPPIPSILATSMKPYTGNSEVETDEIESREGSDWDWDCTLGSLVDRMVEVSGEDQAAAERRLWTIISFDTVELRHLVVGSVISRYVDGELVAVGLRYHCSSWEEILHPVALIC